MTTRISSISLALALAFATACQGPSSRSISIDAASDVKAVMHACRAFAANNDGYFPESLDLLVQRDSTGAAYLEGAKAPLRDSFGTPYRYELLEDGRTCRLVSLGADKRGGGAGMDQDQDFVLSSPR
ncbi:MAG: type II secretion system protein GspG [Planctomycetota bacterium]